MSGRVVVAAAQATMTRLLAEADDLAREVAAASPRTVRDRDMAERAVASELGAALRVSDRAVQSRMSAAATLAADYPRVLAALEAGRIHSGHVRTITDAGAGLPADRRRAFDVRAVAVCETQTPGRAKRTLAMLADRLHPRTLTERHTDARETRRVFVSTIADGMSHLGIDAPTVLVDAAYDRATRMARALIDLRAQAATRVREARAAGVEPDAGDVTCASDTRTMDQLRADLICDLVLTGNPGMDAPLAGDGPGTLGAIRAHVQVVVPVLTLLGASGRVNGAGDDAVALAGREPIDADTARRLAGGAPGSDRILTHPVTAAPSQPTVASLHPTRDDGSRPAISTVDSPAAPLPRSAARPITSSTGREGASPAPRIFRACVSDTTR